MQQKLASGWRLGVWNLVSSQGMQSFLPPSFHSNIYRPHFSLLLAKTYMTPTSPIIRIIHSPNMITP